MRMDWIILWLMVVLVFATTVDAQVGSDLGVIVGRVVDINGRPVPFAQITHSPGPNADLLTSTNADGDGRFELKKEFSRRGTVWITTKVDRNWQVLVKPGFELSKYLVGPVIHLQDRGLDNFLDLGDVLVQVYYSPIKIIFRREPGGSPFSADWMSFRVTDADGNIASEVQLVNPGKAIDASESSITIVLPAGEWKVELRTNKMPWKTVANRLIVKPETPITLNQP